MLQRQTRGGTRSSSSTELLQNFRSADWNQLAETCAKRRFPEVVADTVIMAEEAVVVEEGVSPGQSPLVSVTFQRNIHRKEKYLEAEPKALGITQIGLSAFQILSVTVFLAKGIGNPGIDIAIFISSILVVIAGSVAIAAQNLHMPTLRACMAMQILACGASLCNLICVLIKMEGYSFYCWHYYYDNNTLHLGEICHKIESTHSHFHAENVVLHIALFAISVTLVSYCCKVANCCTPAPKVPVITVQSPPVQQ